MTRKQVCELLGIHKGTLSKILSGKYNSSLAPKIKYLLNFEDNLESVVRRPEFGELCEFVIKRAVIRKESKEVELAMKGKSIRGFVINNYDPNDLDYSMMILFDRVTFLDRKMAEFIQSEYLESMCDIAMRSTKKLAVRKMANTLKLIHQEFWKPKTMNNAVSKM